MYVGLTSTEHGAARLVGWGCSSDSGSYVDLARQTRPRHRDTGYLVESRSHITPPPRLPDFIDGDPLTHESPLRESDLSEKSFRPVDDP
jgi:hypothetical protein